MNILLSTRTVSIEELIIVISIVGITFIYKFLKNKSQEKKENKVHKKINQFKLESIKSSIDFSEIEFVKSNLVSNTVNDRDNHIGVYENTLHIKKEINDIYFDYKIVIEMDPTTLKIKIALKKDIDFYYNPNNPNEYYIDFDFLSQPSKYN